MWQQSFVKNMCPPDAYNQPETLLKTDAKLATAR